MKTTLIDKVKTDMIQRSLVQKGDSVLIAVSGGMDSVCLFHALFSLKDTLSIHLSVAHVNHMLRGAESMRDETFVASLCETHGVPFYVKRMDIKKLAREQKLSVEEAGRHARYAFFNELQKKHQIDAIATAHNKEDNVETVCMRFMRGTGIRGLGGIPVYNDANVIRPLLHISRKEIEAYINKMQYEYVTDSSNLKDDYTRNKIRHHLVPYITQHFNENFIDTLSENILTYSETESFLETYTNTIMQQCVQKEFFGAFANISRLLQEHPAITKRILGNVIKDVANVSVTNKTIQQLYERIAFGCNTAIDISANLAVYIVNNTVYFYDKIKGKNKFFEIEITEGNENITFADKSVIYIKSFIEKDKITIRKRLPGDKMYLGNCGHKKVKDILIDEKVPVFLRDHIPVVLYQDEIIWICGIRDNPNFRAQFGESYIKLTYKRRKDDA